MASIFSHGSIDRKIFMFFRKHSIDWLKLLGISSLVGAETIDILFRDSDGDILYCSGLVKPTNTTSGYAKGCMFIKTDAAAGSKSIYENTGTKTSCVFNLAGEEVPGDLVLAQGSILRGSATGYAEALAHSAAGKVLIGNGTDPVSTTLTEDIKSITAGGTVLLQDRFREKVVTIDATAGVNTWSAAELIGGILRRDCNGGDRADLMPTGALLVAGINSSDPVGTFVDFTITNNGAANTITMAAGGVAGVTFLPASVTIGPGNSKRFIAVVTAAAAYTVYCVGSNAGLIFNADVDPAAAIHLSKIDGLLTTAGFAITGSTSPALVLTPVAAGAGLKIHTHLATGATVDYANEFKGETIRTSGFYDGIAADYKLNGTGTAILRAIRGTAELSAGFSMTGATYTTMSWLAGGVFQASVSGTINGAGVCIAGVSASIGSCNGGTLTQAKYMAALWADWASLVQLGTGESAILLATVAEGPGAAICDYGLLIKAPAGLLTNAIKMNSVATGIRSTVAAVVPAAWGDSAHHFVATSTLPNNEIGIAGYFETHLAGQQAGTVYGFGSWVNLDASFIANTSRICAQDNGVYSDPGAAVLTNAVIVAGMRIECILGAGTNPAAIYMFSTSIAARAFTAVIEVNAAVDLTWTTGGATTNVGKIPLFRDASAGKTWYVNVYDG